ncbi:hypothetical protein GQ457_10G009640 [Hibiscus cannabinus]
MQQYCEVALKQLRSQKAQKASRQNVGPDFSSHGRIKDLKPKRIKDYLECKNCQRNALPKSESAKKICPGRTRCLWPRHPLCHPAQAYYRSP